MYTNSIEAVVSARAYGNVNHYCIFRVIGYLFLSLIEAKCTLCKN